MDYAKAFHKELRAMKKLKLPKIEHLPECHKWLSMDEYIKFLNFNSKYFPGKGDARRSKMDMRVSAPFSIK